MDEAEFLKVLGKHLRKIRKQNKVSLRELELRGDVSRHIISEIENGKRDIRISTLKKIIQALNLTEKEFWEDFKTGKDGEEDLLNESIKRIVKFSASHNDIIQFRKLLQEIADHLEDKSTYVELARFLLIERMKLYDCLNQEGLTSEQEKEFLNIKKRILSSLNEQAN